MDATAKVSPEIAVELDDLSARYAFGVDRRDAALFVSAFADDAELAVYRGGTESEPDFTLRGHSEIAAIPHRLSRYDKTFHCLGTRLYRHDGDHINGETYCTAHHIDRTQATDVVMLVRYIDRYRFAGSWLIARRAVRVEWQVTHDLAAP